MSIQVVETNIDTRLTEEQRIITPTERAPTTRTRSGFVLALACAAMAIVGIGFARSAVREGEMP